MTDDHDPLDDLASAHLDGETTREEAAHIAADRELGARVERLARARDAVRATAGPVDAARRDEAIQAALAAFGEVTTSPAGRTATRIVTPITAAAGHAPRRRSLRLVAVAAAVALLALAVPLLGRLDSGSDRAQTALPAPEAPKSMAAPSAGVAQDSSEMQVAAGTATDRAASSKGAGPATADDLGSFVQLADLTTAVRSRLDEQAAHERNGEIPPTTAPASSCASDPDADGTVVYRALATLDGRAVIAFVREDPEGGRTLVVLDRTDCTRVAGGKL